MQAKDVLLWNRVKARQCDWSLKRALFCSANVAFECVVDEKAITALTATLKIAQAGSL